MKTKFVLALISVFVLTAMIGLNANASQTEDSDNHTVTFDVKPAIEIEVQESTYNFGDVDPIGSPYYTPQDAITVNVKCNTNWTLRVKGEGNFSNGSDEVPLSRLEWMEDWNGNENDWDGTEMTTSDVDVTSGTQTSNSGTDVKMEYRLTITYEDPVGDNYATTIVYTGTVS